MSDVTKIGSYSPETFEAQWLDGATGPAVGARFRGPLSGLVHGAVEEHREQGVDIVVKVELPAW